MAEACYLASYVNYHVMINGVIGAASMIVAWELFQAHRKRRKGTRR